MTNIWVSTAVCLPPTPKVLGGLEKEGETEDTLCPLGIQIEKGTGRQSPATGGFHSPHAEKEMGLWRDPGQPCIVMPQDAKDHSACLGTLLALGQGPFLTVILSALATQEDR